MEQIVASLEPDRGEVPPPVAPRCGGGGGTSDFRLASATANAAEILFPPLGSFTAFSTAPRAFSSCATFLAVCLTNGFFAAAIAAFLTSGFLAASNKAFAADTENMDFQKVSAVEQAVVASSFLTKSNGEKWGNPKCLPFFIFTQLLCPFGYNQTS
ncbi:hypothetical protein GCK72_009311 [Caenorhabditis remanei]|uniref:Uncharacterized protein n=1 Tax=Caenorhabditis remanei TaxID=31234 RepID=A0A6A5H1E0_CAERE|nr:hypothetical protein GCK72_009311 [Caenorhabditis remanei]KAF1761057.1 hypothetical protein GCK72_009311 [Caenorhabditis remanei]